MTIRGSEHSVVWSTRDAPVVCFGGLWPGYVSQAHHVLPPGDFGAPFRRPEPFELGHLYSHAMSNNFRTNFPPVQVADAIFRYALTSCPGDPSGLARRFGWAVSNPLESVAVPGGRKGRLPAVGQLCRVDGQAALLLALKKAEDGRGVVVRLLETDGRAGVASLRFAHHTIVYAAETDLVEEDLRLLSCDSRAVEVPLRAHRITTIRCVLAG